MHAAENGNAQIIRFLLKNSDCHINIDALMLAIEEKIAHDKKHSEKNEKSKDYNDTIKLLLKHGRLSP